jgi:cytoplasmic tRNA 2-thiolation protein 2
MATKFRRTLEPSINIVPDGPRKKGLKPAGNLCLAFSGGLGSTVLLDLVSRSYFSHQAPEEEGARGGKDHPRNVGVWKKATVCYVELCNALPGVRSSLNRSPSFLIHRRLETARTMCELS